MFEGVKDWIQRFSETGPSIAESPECAPVLPRFLELPNGAKVDRTQHPELHYLMRAPTWAVDAWYDSVHRGYAGFSIPHLLAAELRFTMRAFSTANTDNTHNAACVYLGDVVEKFVRDAERLGPLDECLMAGTLDRPTTWRAGRHRLSFAETEGARKTHQTLPANYAKMALENLEDIAKVIGSHRLPHLASHFAELIYLLVAIRAGEPVEG